MKLKVVDDYRRHEWIEADTIGTLKASITGRFSLTADHLSQQRLLVRDNRDLALDRIPITGCVDLLQLSEESILDDGSEFCKNGDTLLLGWKGPCNVKVISGCIRNLEFKVDNDITLSQLKQKIVSLNCGRVTEEKLPQVLLEGDNEKPLLFFGFYIFSKGFESPFEIYLSKNNVLPRSPRLRIRTYPTQYRAGYFGEDLVEEHKSLSVLRWDDDGCIHYIPFMEFYYGNIPVEEEEEDKKNNKNQKRKRQSKENIEENKKKKKKNNNNNNKSKENIENQQKKKNNNNAGIVQAYGELPDNVRLNEGIVDDEDDGDGDVWYIEFEDEDIDKI